MDFQVSTKDGRSVKVEADNWMLAMGKALSQLKVGGDLTQMGRWIINPQRDGRVVIDDPKGGDTYIVVPVKAAPQIKVMVSARSAAVDEAEEEEEYRKKDDDDKFDAAAPPPSLDMPVRSALSSENQPPSLTERIFDLSIDIVGESDNFAAATALALLVEFIPCEAASILRGNINDSGLKFLAASGPVGDELIGRTLPFGTGLVGLCYDLRNTMVVLNVERDSRHYGDIDEETGFDTKAVLCVPVLDDTHHSIGVIQILNPPKEFKIWQVEAAESVARTLAQALQIRF